MGIISISFNDRVKQRSRQDVGRRKGAALASNGEGSGGVSMMLSVVP